MNFKRTLAALLSAVLAMSAFTVVSFADTPGVTLPANIDGKGYTTKTVLDFDEENIEDSFSYTATRASFEVVENGGASGKALKMTSIGDTAEGTVVFSETQDWTGYDGLLYYVDVSDVTMTKDTTGTGIRVETSKGTMGTTRNDKGFADGVEAFDTTINAYYLDSTGTWQLCDDSKRNGERTQYPEDFSGWVYVPFSSYIAHKSWKMTGKGIPDADSVKKITFLTGPYTKGQGTVIVDDIQLVKLGDTAMDVGVAAAQLSTDGNTARVLGVVDSLSYAGVGFKYTVTNGGSTVAEGTHYCKTVYSSVIADGETVGAERFGGKFIFALNFNGVIEGDVITVTAIADTSSGTEEYNTQAYTYSSGKLVASTN